MTEAAPPKSDEKHAHLAPIDPAIRAGATAWIISADAKATALLAVASVLLAAVAFASGASTTYAERMFLLFFCLFTLASIAASAGVLWPRTKRLSILGSGRVNRLDCSPTYFGEMGKRSYDDFRAELEKTTSETLLRDAYEQTYIELKIARSKMSWMRCSIGLLAASLVLLAGFVLARAFENAKDSAHEGATGSNMTAPTPTPPNDTQTRPARS